jgi:diketogulonate reductase-like aldo/keto reductase
LSAPAASQHVSLSATPVVTALSEAFEPPGLSLIFAQVINETLPALQALKQQGLVRFIGITGLPFKSLTYVLDRVPPGEQVM